MCSSRACRRSRSPARSGVSSRVRGCGRRTDTGGDGRGTFNVSTVAALVAAGNLGAAEQATTAALATFSLSKSYPLAFVFLFAAGFLELSFNAMAQTLVQLNAPPDKRGRVIGLFNMSSLGLRAFSGVSVGLAGSVIGVHWSLALSALATLVAAGALLALP